MITCNKCYDGHHDQRMEKAGMFDCGCRCLEKWNTGVVNAIFIGLEPRTRLMRYANMKKYTWKRSCLNNQKNNMTLISPKGTNIPGSYRKCEETECTRLVPCPHVRCQEHRTDMAIKDWVVQHKESWLILTTSSFQNMAWVNMSNFAVHTKK